MKPDPVRIKKYLNEIRKNSLSLNQLIEENGLTPDSVPLKAAKYTLIELAEGMSNTDDAPEIAPVQPLDDVVGHRAPGGTALGSAVGPKGTRWQGDHAVVIGQSFGQQAVASRRKAVGMGQMDDRALSAKVVEPIGLAVDQDFRHPSPPFVSASLLSDLSYHKSQWFPRPRLVSFRPDGLDAPKRFGLDIQNVLGYNERVIRNVLVFAELLE